MRTFPGCGRVAGDILCAGLRENTSRKKRRVVFLSMDPHSGGTRTIFNWDRNGTFMHSIRIRSVRRAGGVLAVAFDETAARGNLKNLSGEYVMRGGTKTTIRRLRQGALWAVVAVAGISRICLVSAADVTFTGGVGSFDWSQPSNWVGEILPGAGDVAVFSANSGDATVSGLAAGEVAGLRFVNPGPRGSRVCRRVRLRPMSAVGSDSTTRPSTTTTLSSTTQALAAT